jgi:Nitroreductase family.
MPWVRRTRHLVLGIDEDGSSKVVVHSLLTGRRVRLAPDELGALLDVSAATPTWRDAGDPWVAEHGADGLLVTDDPHEPYAGLRLRDAELTALGWWPDAAALHVGARWEGVRARVPSADGSLRPRAPYVAPALPAFPDRGGPRVELPRSDGDSALHDLLACRRTVRTFDAGRPVELAELATLLRWVWGARGTIRLKGGDVGLRRTSPSGGSFHPIEVYPFVRNVDGLAPGVYHYLGAEHVLEAIDLRAEPAVRELLDEAMAGQWFFAESDVAFVMTARFGRSNRKYRRTRRSTARSSSTPATSARPFISSAPSSALARGSPPRSTRASSSARSGSIRCTRASSRSAAAAGRALTVRSGRSSRRSRRCDHQAEPVFGCGDGLAARG